MEWYLVKYRYVIVTIIGILPFVWGVGECRGNATKRKRLTGFSCLSLKPNIVLKCYHRANVLALFNGISNPGYVKASAERGEKVLRKDKMLKASLSHVEFCHVSQEREQLSAQG
jgi:hypothetical protein